MSLKNRAVSAALCVALLLGLTGCTFGKHFGVVATVTGGDQSVEYSDGIYLYYQYAGFTTAVSTLGEGADLKVGNVLKKKITVDEKEIAVTDFIKSECEKNLLKHGAIDVWFEKEGLTLDDATVKQINSQAQAGWDSYMKDMLQPNGVSYETYRVLVENYFKQQALYAKFYGEDSDNLLSEQEIADAVEETYMRRQLIKFPKVDAENKAIAAEDKAKVLALVDEATKAMTDGMSITDAVDKYMPQVLALTSKAKYTSAEAYITTEYVPYIGGAYAEGQITKLKETANGAFNYYEDTRTVYCWQKEDVLTKDSKYLEKAAASQEEAKQSAFNTKLDEYTKGFEVSYNEDALKHYDPKKIKY